MPEPAFAQRAPYLFHAPAQPGALTPPGGWDQGLRSFQCSRKADVLKLWVALQRHGADGIGALYAHLCDTTRALYERLGYTVWQREHASWPQEDQYGRLSVYETELTLLRKEL